MHFSILGSSSSGNCGLLVTEDCKALVDIGFSCRRTCELLEDHAIKPQEIDAIFITHEHGDHTCGLSTFCKRFQPDVYANILTARALQPKLKHRPNWKLFHTGATFEFRSLKIDSFSVPHDAQDPVGFTFSAGRGDLFSPYRSLAWLTDLGFAPRHIAQRIQNVDMLVIETNYDPDLLERDSRRPWSVKQRISGRHGHLSNTAARDLLLSIDRPRWSHVFLAHLSRDCNSVDAVETTFADLANASRYTLETIAAGLGSKLQAV